MREAFAGTYGTVFETVARGPDGYDPLYHKAVSSITTGRRGTAYRDGSRSVDLHRVIPAADAILGTYTTSAAFQPATIGKPGGTAPRIERKSLEAIEGAGGVTIATTIFVDVDLPNPTNRKPKPRWWDADVAVDPCVAIPAKLAEAGITGWLTGPSGGGFHMVRPLAEPVVVTPEAVPEIQARYRAVLASLAAAGLGVLRMGWATIGDDTAKAWDIDHACDNWSRSFRLPWITKAGVDLRFPIWGDPEPLRLDDFAPLWKPGESPAEVAEAARLRAEAEAERQARIDAEDAARAAAERAGHRVARPDLLPQHDRCDVRGFLDALGVLGSHIGSGKWAVRELPGMTAARSGRWDQRDGDIALLLQQDGRYTVTSKRAKDGGGTTWLARELREIDPALFDSFCPNTYRPAVKRQPLHTAPLPPLDNAATLAERDAYPSAVADPASARLDHYFARRGDLFAPLPVKPGGAYTWKAPVRCPFCDHSGDTLGGTTETIIGRRSDGRFDFRCAAESCTGRTVHALIELDPEGIAGVCNRNIRRDDASDISQTVVLTDRVSAAPSHGDRWHPVTPSTTGGVGGVLAGSLVRPDRDAVARSLDLVGMGKLAATLRGDRDPTLRETVFIDGEGCTSTKPAHPCADVRFSSWAAETAGGDFATAWLATHGIIPGDDEKPTLPSDHLAAGLRVYVSHADLAGCIAAAQDARRAPNKGAIRGREFPTRGVALVIDRGASTFTPARWGASGCDATIPLSIAITGPTRTAIEETAEAVRAAVDAAAEAQGGTTRWGDDAPVMLSHADAALYLARTLARLPVWLTEPDSLRTWLRACDDAGWGRFSTRSRCGSLASNPQHGGCWQDAAPDSDSDAQAAFTVTNADRIEARVSEMQRHHEGAVAAAEAGDVPTAADRIEARDDVVVSIASAVSTTLAEDSDHARREAGERVRPALPQRVGRGGDTFSGPVMHRVLTDLLQWFRPLSVASLNDPRPADEGAVAPWVSRAIARVQSALVRLREIPDRDELRRWQQVLDERDAVDAEAVTSPEYAADSWRRRRDLAERKSGELLRRGEQDERPTGADVASGIIAHCKATGADPDEECVAAGLPEWSAAIVRAAVAANLTTSEVTRVLADPSRLDAYTGRETPKPLGQPDKPLQWRDAISRGPDPSLAEWVADELMQARRKPDQAPYGPDNDLEGHFEGLGIHPRLAATISASEAAARARIAESGDRYLVGCRPLDVGAAVAEWAYREPEPAGGWWQRSQAASR